MSIEKQKALVDALVRRTDQGDIVWSTTIEDNVFKVDFSRHSLTLKYGTTFDSESECIITLINESGQEADSFSDNDLDDQSETSPAKRYYWFRRMRDLYNSARRSALGSDRVLNEIMSELGEDDPF